MNHISKGERLIIDDTAHLVGGYRIRQPNDYEVRVESKENAIRIFTLRLHDDKKYLNIDSVTIDKSAYKTLLEKMNNLYKEMK